eukprot:2796378-Rhodomonas_salina.1
MLVGDLYNTLLQQNNVTFRTTPRLLGNADRNSYPGTLGIPTRVSIPGYFEPATNLNKRMHHHHNKIH